LLGFQLCKVGQNICYRLAMFSFTALRNISPIHRLIVRAVSISISSHSEALLSSEIVSVSSEIVSVRDKSYYSVRDES
jgi:hypothetical protein